MPWQNPPIASIFQAGNRVILNTHGLFVYNGAPVLGNLIASVTFASGTDPFGNLYNAGLNSYGQTPYNNANANLAVDQGSGDVLLNMQPSSNPAPNQVATIPQIITSVLFPTATVERQQLFIGSGTETGATIASITMTSESADLSVGSQIAMIAQFLGITSPSAQAQITMVSSRATMLTSLPQFLAQTISGGLAAEQQFMALTTGNENSQFGAEFALESDSANGAAQANASINFPGPSSNNQVATFTKSRVTLGTSSWPAAVTANRGTQANATLIQTDVWHQVPSFSNGWVSSGVGVQGMWYKLTTHNELEIKWDLLNPASSFTSIVVTFTGSLIPLTPQNGACPWNNPGVTAPWSAIDASGNFSIDGYSAANKACWGHEIFTLDLL